MKRISVLLFVCASALAETETTEVYTPTTSGNLLPNILQWTPSGDATIEGGGAGCQQSDVACTGWLGGTFATSVDLENEMTIPEINRGFTLENFGVSVDSHSSNASLPTCDAIESGDCQDTFKMTISFSEDGQTVGPKFEHTHVLDFSGERLFEYGPQTISANEWTQLTMWTELYGIDEGWTGGLYGPQFSDPFATVGYDAIEYIVTEIEQMVQEDIEDVVEMVMAEEEQLVAEVVTPVETVPVVVEEEQELTELEIFEELVEEIYTNPVLSEVVGTNVLVDFDTIEVTISEPDGTVADSFQVDFDTETLTGTGQPLGAMSVAPVEMDSTSFDAGAVDFDPGGFEAPGELAELEMPDMPDIEPMADLADLADLDLPDLNMETPTEMVAAPAVEVEVETPALEVESEVEVAETPALEPEAEVEVAEPSTEVAEAESEATDPEQEQEVAEAEPEAAGSNESEPTKVVAKAESKSGPATKEKPSTEKSTKMADKAKAKRLGRKVAARVMQHLASSYDVAAQSVALSVMAYQAPTYTPAVLPDAPFYPLKELDGGTNYDHPAARWFTATANQRMNELVDSQWQR